MTCLRRPRCPLSGGSFRRKSTRAEKPQKLVREKAADDEEIDPRLAQLIAKGMRAIEELDPIVRETFRDDPAALAEWDEIMRTLDEPDENPEMGENSETPR